MRRIRHWFAVHGLSVLNFIKAALVGVGLVLLINLQVSNARQVRATRESAAATRQLAAQINEAVAELKANTNMQLGQANSHIDCIAQFFAQPDRTNRTLADLQSCDIQVISTQTHSNAAGGAVVPKVVPTTTQTQKEQSAASPQAVQPQNQSEPQAQPSFLDRTVQNVLSFPTVLLHSMTGL